MAPTKAKGKKTKGVTSLVSPTNIPKRAGDKKQVSATTVQGQHLMSPTEVASCDHDDVSQKLDTNEEDGGPVWPNNEPIQLSRGH